ncbi:SAC3 family protein A-like [Arachis duranensis]|uniref:SAC3 family protein A-like n=1 Tax=Arachis duranensis TaxID=130453 RepID=A0A9C6T1V6_ARADU|nr:SAC3 family protein A-like [Arachis duranensis]
MQQPGMFPKSLRVYCERAFARCKDEKQMAACQAVMKEMKAIVDGTLYTQNWDMEPLFPMPDADNANKVLVYVKKFSCFVGEDTITWLSFDGNLYLFSVVLTIELLKFFNCHI